MVRAAYPRPNWGTLSGDVVRPAPRLGPRLVQASSTCGADGRFAVGAAGALNDFPICQRTTQAMSVVTLKFADGFWRGRGPLASLGNPAAIAARPAAAAGG